MPDTSSSISRRVNRRVLVHSARTAVAALVSLAVARALGLPEAYWATITTLIIMQSTFGAALTVSEQRFAGTALGAVMGALLTTYFGSNPIVFGLGVFAIGLICAAVRGRRMNQGQISCPLIPLRCRTQSTISPVLPRPRARGRHP
jgi:uncharacterized membrane protein YccC